MAHEHHMASSGHDMMHAHHNHVQHHSPDSMLPASSTPSPNVMNALHHVHASMSESAVAHEMGMHSMTFHFGFEQFVLIEQWSAQNVTSLSLTCLFFFVCAILYEFIKAYRRVITVKQSSTSALVTNKNRRCVNELENSEFPCDSTLVHTSHQHDGGPTSSSSGQGRGGVVNTPGDNSANSSLSGVSHNGRQKLVRDSADGNTYIAHMGDACDVADVVAVCRRGLSNDTSAVAGGGGGQHSRPTAVTPSTRVRMFATRSEMFCGAHLFGTVLYTVQVVMAYLLMLAFMLFNVWICIAILAGAAVGHFFLAQKAAIALDDHQNEDHCH